jgi:Tfp pilus assembly protein PilX
MNHSPPDNRPPRGRSVVAWVITLVVLGVLVLLSFQRAMVEEKDPLHTHSGNGQVVTEPGRL